MIKELERYANQTNESLRDLCGVVRRIVIKMDKLEEEIESLKNKKYSIPNKNIKGQASMTCTECKNDLDESEKQEMINLGIEAGNEFCMGCYRRYYDEKSYNGE